MKNGAGIFFFLVITCLARPVSASDLWFKLTIERQSYAMSALRQLQESIANSFVANDISLQQTHRFPDRLSFSAHLLGKTSFGRIGLSYGYASTGGRLHYADRSGAITIDQVVSNHAFGMNVELLLLSKKISFFAYINPQMLFSQIDHTEEVSVAASQVQNTVTYNPTFNRNHLAIEPGFTLQVPMTRFFVELHVGYLISTPVTPDTNSLLRTHLVSRSDVLRLEWDWSGLRIGISGGFQLQ